MRPGLGSGRLLREVADDLIAAFSALPDEAWAAPALGLEWSCRATASHLCGDFGSYALQLAGTRPPQDRYLEFLEPESWDGTGYQDVFWPDPAGGTATILSCLDGAAGLLCAVVATSGPEKRGYHPSGLSDAAGFEAMGLVEATLHARDILGAHSLPYRPADAATSAAVARLFPASAGSPDPWQALLAATGRTPETAGKPWRWDSSVR